MLKVIWKRLLMFLPANLENCVTTQWKRTWKDVEGRDELLQRIHGSCNKPGLGKQMLFVNIR
jgi:hypothetical protein